jgi:phosphopantetheinyl transferase (holo-ACP synthase)
MAGIGRSLEERLLGGEDARGGYWTDIEIGHDAERAPVIRLHGALRERFERRGWRALVSISHSGDYVSTVVVIAGGHRDDAEWKPR